MNECSYSCTPSHIFMASTQTLLSFVLIIASWCLQLIKSLSIDLKYCVIHGCRVRILVIRSLNRCILLSWNVSRLRLIYWGWEFLADIRFSICVGGTQVESYLITLTDMRLFVSVTLSKRQHVFGPVCGWSAQLRVICSLGTSLCQTYPNLSPSLEPNSCIPYPSPISEITPLFLSPEDWFPLLSEKKPSYLIYFLWDISVSQVYFLLRRAVVFGMEISSTPSERAIYNFSRI